MDESEKITKSDSEVKIKVEGCISEVPDELKNSVYESIKNTIFYSLDNHTIFWKKENNKFILSFDNIPEIIVGPNKALPPYRARERLEGTDKNKDGFMQNLPDNWNYEVKNNSSYIFYKN